MPAGHVLAKRSWVLNSTRRMDLRSAMSIFAVVALASSDCSPYLPEPPAAAQPTSALIEVDFPPPPARVELLPPRPSSNTIWVKGEWVWAGRRWSWRPGAWVIPPEGAAYARHVLVRRADGK